MRLAIRRTAGYTTYSAFNVLLRIISSAFTIPMALGLASLMVASVRDYRSRVEGLEQEQARLAQALEQSTAAIRARQEDAVERVEALLAAELIHVSEGSPEQALASLQDLVGDVVRPLSHELARDIPEWEPMTVSAAQVRISWNRVWRNLPMGDAISPAAIAVAIVILGLPGGLLFFGPLGGLRVLIAGALTMLVAGSLARVILRRLPAAPPWLGWGALLLLLTICGGLVCVAGAVAAGDVPDRWVLAIPGWCAVVIFGLLLAIVQATRAQMQSINALLTATTMSLRWHVARVHTVQWQQRGELSRALHGPVQAALHAAMYRLRQHVAEGTATPELVADIRLDVQRSLAALMVDGEECDVIEHLTAVRDTWRGVAEVRWHLDSGTETALRADRVCGDLLCDVAAEAVSNAVRHGRATSVMISASNDEPDILRLQVRDDGVAEGPGGRTGLGTSLLAACSCSWSLVRGEGMTLEADLPLQPRTASQATL